MGERTNDAGRAREQTTAGLRRRRPKAARAAAAVAGKRRRAIHDGRASELAIGRRRATDDGGPTTDARATVAARDRRRDRRRDRLGERAAAGERFTAGQCNSSRPVQRKYHPPINNPPNHHGCKIAQTSTVQL